MGKHSLNSGEEIMIKLSTEQLERLAERAFEVLKYSGYVSLDPQTDDRIEDKVLSAILDVLADDSRAEEKLSREAERLVQQQSQIAKSSGKSFDSLVDEVKSRLAKSKKIILGDVPERADALAEKMINAIWKLEGVDFFVENFKVQNCLARAIHRFRLNDDRLLDAVEKITTKKTQFQPYSHDWCIAFDKNYHEVLSRIAERSSSEET